MRTKEGKRSPFRTFGLLGGAAVFRTEPKSGVALPLSLLRTRLGAGRRQRKKRVRVGASEITQYFSDQQQTDGRRFSDRTVDLL